MGIGRADLALFSGFIQFPGEGSEPRAAPPLGRPAAGPSEVAVGWSGVSRN